MKQAEKIWKRRWRTVCGIILLQVFLCPLFATNLQLKDGGILIVNANSDLSPLCNHIISELIHSLPVEYKGMAISPENLNLAQVYDEMQMDTRGTESRNWWGPVNAGVTLVWKLF